MLVSLAVRTVDAQEGGPMTSSQSLVLGACYLLAFVAWSRHWFLNHELEALPELSVAQANGADAIQASLSVMIPARDEEQNIGRCLDALIDQAHTDFEIIVVDDRSSDQTVAIVKSYQPRFKRLRLLSVDRLPLGWSGKCHALQHAQQFALGSWLLFLDADVTLAPRALDVALSDAIYRQADLYTVIPGAAIRSLWEGVLQPFMGLLLMTLHPPSRVNQPRVPSTAFANGQFLMVRRSTYDAIGQHRGVQSLLLEDLGLAKNALARSFDVCAVHAKDLVSVRMYATLRAHVRGWSRIFFSSEQGRVHRLYFLLMMVVLFNIAYPLEMVVAVWAHGFAGWRHFSEALMLCSALHGLGQESLLFRAYRQTGVAMRFFLLRPLAVATSLVILMRAIGLSFSRQIHWRGATYRV